MCRGIKKIRKGWWKRWREREKNMKEVWEGERK